MSKIKKLKLKNFKRFSKFEVEFRDNLNILAGENESGKSTILSAIDLVLRGSRNRIESIGMENLLNRNSVDKFFEDKNYKNLPKAYVEIYLTEQDNPELNGKINSEQQICDGLKMELRPNDDLSSEIKDIISNDDNIFPYEYYEVAFTTFASQSYSGYKKYIRHLVLDSSRISIVYATREYVNDIYQANVDRNEHIRHEFQYRAAKTNFQNSEFTELNDQNEYSFALKNDSNSNLLSDLTLMDGNISIEHKGQGMQSFIKTDFALRKTTRSARQIDLVLMEEPENHLSHLNMNKLIENVQNTSDKQLFIATHNTLIAARLDLRNLLLVHPDSNTLVQLSSLEKSTAKFFVKAPQSNVLEFTLSKKVLLVEGPSEFLLMEKMFSKIAGDTLANRGVHVISVWGLSFSRYLEIAKILKIRVAVIRDNDRDYHKVVEPFHEKFEDKHLEIFTDKNNDRYTFEVCIYRDNKDLCEKIFDHPNTKDILKYMQNNKTESAYRLLDSELGDNLTVPAYISEAIKWINE